MTGNIKEYLFSTSNFRSIAAFTYEMVDKMSKVIYFSILRRLAQAYTPGWNDIIMTYCSGFIIFTG